MATAEPVPPSTKPIAQPSVSNEVPTSNTAAKTSPSKQNQIIAAGLPSKAADKTTCKRVVQTSRKLAGNIITGDVDSSLTQNHFGARKIHPKDHKSSSDNNPPWLLDYDAPIPPPKKSKLAETRSNPIWGPENSADTQRRKGVKIQQDKREGSFDFSGDKSAPVASKPAVELLTEQMVQEKERHQRSIEYKRQRRLEIEKHVKQEEEVRQTKDDEKVKAWHTKYASKYSTSEAIS